MSQQDYSVLSFEETVYDKDEKCKSNKVWLGICKAVEGNESPEQIGRIDIEVMQNLKVIITQCLPHLL